MGTQNILLQFSQASGIPLRVWIEVQLVDILGLQSPVPTAWLLTSLHVVFLSTILLNKFLCKVKK